MLACSACTTNAPAGCNIWACLRSFPHRTRCVGSGGVCARAPPRESRGARRHARDGRRGVPRRRPEANECSRRARRIVLQTALALDALAPSRCSSAKE
eukprot:791178-Prymnesium_polylepis.1